MTSGTLRVVRWMRIPALAVISLCLFVVGADGRLLLGIKVPGPRWIYIGAGILVLMAGFIIDRPGLYWALKVLGFDQLLEYEGRRFEYREVVQNMNRTLRVFTRRELEPSELKDIEDLPPVNAKDDVKCCCRSLAIKRKNDPEAQVLELLYLGSRGLDTQTLWEKTTPPQRQKLARILAKSGELDGFDNCDQAVSALEWFFDRIDYFDLELVKSEIRVLVKLWRHLKDFADYLGRSDLSKVIPDLSSSAELKNLRSDVAKKLGTVLLSQAKYEDVAVYLLGRKGKEWICAWDETLPEEVAASLAVVSLGICTAETSAIRSPLMSDLSLRVAHDKNALEILFGYLWRKSRLDFDVLASTDLSALAKWKVSVAGAEGEMGTEITREVRGTLHSELTNNAWPTWLPIHQANAQLVAESHQIYDSVERLASAPARGADWELEMSKLLDRLDLKISLKSAALFETIKETVDKKYATTGRTPHSAQEVEEGLNDFAARTFRPETKLAGYLAKYQSVLDTLELFRERAADLTRQLYELGGEIEAEAAGSAYLITFDQTRGPLADLIDSLQQKHNFKPYTRYSRIGKLRLGQGFESFYSEFEADLEKLIEAATNTDFKSRLKAVGITVGADPRQLGIVVSEIESAHEEQRTATQRGSESGHEEQRIATQGRADWEQVEITVQQLFHRHDFIRDAKIKTIIHTPPFKIPPTPEVSVKALHLP